MITGQLDGINECFRIRGQSDSIEFLSSAVREYQLCAGQGGLGGVISMWVSSTAHAVPSLIMKMNT